MSLFEELIEDRQEDEKIVKSFKTKDSLSPEIFKRDGESFVMHDDVRKQLLKICDHFLDTLGVEFFVHDIILTGSLANYNWSSYSDVDLHIILDMDEFGTEDKNQILLRNIFKEFFDTKKDYWNNKHNIKIKGFDVEIYVQDLKEPHISSGVYSLVHNKWVIEPERKSPKIDDKKIIDKAEEVEEKIKSLFKNPHDKDIVDKIDILREKIRKFRKCGLDNGGEYSYENLVFKLLRRNGLIDDLIRFKHSVTDKRLSINESPDEIWSNNQINFYNKEAIPFGIYEGDMIIGYNREYLPKETQDKIEEVFVEGQRKVFDHTIKYLYSLNSGNRYDIHPQIPIFHEILYELGIEKHKHDFETFRKTKDFWRTMFDFAGRLWVDDKIISFWKYPDEKSEFVKVLNMINRKLDLIYHFTLDFNQFKIEVKIMDDDDEYHYEVIPIKDYIGGYVNASEKELTAPHTLPPDEKAKHPQMIAAKKSKIDFIGQKEKGWNSMANRNFMLQKNIAEDKNE